MRFADLAGKPRMSTPHFYLVVLASLTIASTTNARPLEEVVALTLQKSPTVRGTTADRMIGDGRVLEAQAGYKPKAELSAETNYRLYKTVPRSAISVTEEGAAPPSDPRWSTGAYLTIRQTIFDGGVTRSAVKSAKLSREAVEYNVASARINVALTAINDYFEVVSLIGQEIAAQDALRQLQALVDYAQHRAADCQRRQPPLPADEESQCQRFISDYHYASERLLALNGESKRLHNEFRDAYARLLRNMGEPVPDSLRKGDPKLAFALPKGFAIPQRGPDMPNSPSEAMSQARLRNPLVINARFNQRIAEENRRGIDARRSSPLLEGVVTFGQIDPIDRNRTSNEGYVGFRATWQLYDAGVARAQKMQAVGEYQKARAQEDDAMLTTENAINRVFNFWEHSRDRLDNLERRHAMQRDVYFRRSGSYLGGDTNFFVSEVTESIEALFDIRSQQALMRARSAYAPYDVHGSMGTLLEQLRLSSR